MSCGDEKKGVADRDTFWVKIQKKDIRLKLEDNDFVAENETEKLSGGKYKISHEYHIVAVCEDNDGNLGEKCEPKPLAKFSAAMCEAGEFITEMKSVEMHFVRVQTAEQIKQGENRWCPVNSTWVWCR